MDINGANKILLLINPNSKKSDLLFQYKKLEDIVTDLNYNRSENFPYWITFLAFESDGNFFKTINVIKDVSRTHFEKMIDVSRVEGVHPDGACPDPPRDAMRAVDVPRPDAGGQAVIGVVGDGDRLVLVLSWTAGLGLCLVAAGIVLVPGLPLVSLLVSTQMLNAVLLVPLLVLMTFLSRDVSVLGEHVVPRAQLVVQGVVVAAVDVVAVASRDQARAVEYAARKGISRAYGSYDEMLAADDVEAALGGEHLAVLGPHDRRDAGLVETTGEDPGATGLHFGVELADGFEGRLHLVLGGHVARAVVVHGEQVLLHRILLWCGTGTVPAPPGSPADAPPSYDGGVSPATYATTTQWSASTTCTSS
mgnify:CR=1 FL=1